MRESAVERGLGRKRPACRPEPPYAVVSVAVGRRPWRVPAPGAGRARRGTRDELLKMRTVTIDQAPDKTLIRVPRTGAALCAAGDVGTAWARTQSLTLLVRVEGVVFRLHGDMTCVSAIRGAGVSRKTVRC